jgi:hypothetical protein
MSLMEEAEVEMKKLQDAQHKVSTTQDNLSKKTTEHKDLCLKEQVCFSSLFLPSFLVCFFVLFCFLFVCLLVFPFLAEPEKANPLSPRQNYSSPKDPGGEEGKRQQEAGDPSEIPHSPFKVFYLFIYLKKLVLNQPVYYPFNLIQLFILVSVLPCTPRSKKSQVRLERWSRKLVRSSRRVTRKCSRSALTLPGLTRRLKCTTRISFRLCQHEA